MVRNNLFVDYIHYALNLESAKKILVYNNLIYNTCYLSAIISAFGSYTEITGKIFNNIFQYDNRTASLSVFGWDPGLSPGLEYGYNLFYSTGEPIKIYGNQTVKQGQNNVIGDAMLVAPNAADKNSPRIEQIEETKALFKIKFGSPAIDAGIASLPNEPLFDPSFDYQNTKRPIGNGVDIGPHEFDPSQQNICIQDNTEKRGLGLYIWQGAPGQINIKYLCNFGPSILKCHNIQGQLVNQKTLFPFNTWRQTHISMPNTPGLFVIQLRNGKKDISSKVLITR